MSISIGLILAAALVLFVMIGGSKGVLAALALVIAAVVAVFLWNAVAAGRGAR